MVQFEKLRLSGFKSFADRTELDIGPGLNGVVGPNGCGKSNLLEALRWVMGENSAKRMRGGGMEDVIFAGSASRSSRNIADVSLLLNNQDRQAPAAYNGFDEIEVLRKIEKDHGSTYKINGKTVRARDVHMLFADSVTGANSPAMVSQGRITAIINAKPQQRRLILEESAGISGLYARRHEAELRLRAAENNLTRLEDLLENFEKQLGGLKRQARQASKYKNLSAQIRQLDVLIAYLEWRVIAEEKEAEKQKFLDAEKLVGEKLLTVTQLSKTQNTQTQELPALRRYEAEAAASLQTQKIALQRIEDEAKRAEDALEETQKLHVQSSHDLTHEQNSLDESTKMLETITQEQTTLIEVQTSSEKNLNKKAQIREDIKEQVTTMEAQYNALTESAAETRARLHALEQKLEHDNDRHATLLRRKEESAEKLETLCAQQDTQNTSQKLTTEISRLQDFMHGLENSIDEQRTRIQTITDAMEHSATEMQDRHAAYSKAQAEADLLQNLIASSEQDIGSSILDDIQSAPGFEKALSRALGDSLRASIDDSHSYFWRQRSDNIDLPELPESIQALRPHIKAPAVLKNALSQIGVVDTQAQGQQAFEKLLPGQSLVSKDGHFWRWDGYCTKDSATDSNAQHLEHKNTLLELLEALPHLKSAVDTLEKSRQEQAIDKTDLESALKDKQEKLSLLQRDLRIAEKNLHQLHEKESLEQAEKKRYEEALATLHADISDIELSIKDSQSALNACRAVQNAEHEQQLHTLRDGLQETRERYQDAITDFNTHTQQQKSREARLRAIADERISLKNRIIRSKERVKELEARITETSQRLEELKAQPKDFASGQQSLLSKISTLEAERGNHAEKLSACEAEVLETNKALKEAEQILGNAREARAHAQATLSALEDRLSSLDVSIQERFSMAPKELVSASAFDVESAHNRDLADHKNERDTLMRSRESIGPVNLRAEEEATELEKEVGGLLYERNDLSQAIDELRGGIDTINKEARERLMAAFDHVNGHFQALFKRLFQGGEAHLALIESDDPLGAGLEIFAQPPGKSLQSLSLLSGGEQTMASIALIFAMFLTNPSPICVLDEIDAPLDDANVDRMCDLLEEIAERGETRFLIITHHRLTMARMHRLYGVTMAERGISQLVSVDLQQSFSFLDEAA